METAFSGVISRESGISGSSKNDSPILDFKSTDKWVILNRIDIYFQNGTHKNDYCDSFSDIISYRF